MQAEKRAIIMVMVGKLGETETVLVAPGATALVTCVVGISSHSVVMSISLPFRLLRRSRFGEQHCVSRLASMPTVRIGVVCQEEARQLAEHCKLVSSFLQAPQLHIPVHAPWHRTHQTQKQRVMRYVRGSR